MTGNCIINIISIVDDVISPESGYIAGKKIGNAANGRRFKKGKTKVIADFTGIDKMSEEFIWNLSKALYIRNYAIKKSRIVFSGLTNMAINAIEETIAEVAKSRTESTRPKLSIDKMTVCPTCGIKANLSNESGYWRWTCSKCGAYVGCHKDSMDHLPLGILADPELRQWRMKIHNVFDMLWIYKMKKTMFSKHQSRRLAYQWLGKTLQMEANECHIALFTLEQCKKAYSVCLPYARVIASKRTIEEGSVL